MSDPIFKNVAHALRFAFDRDRGSVARPQLNKMAAPSGRGEPSLAGLDGAGQAGMIRLEVERLGVVLHSVLLARFAPQRMLCGCQRLCCCGYIENPEWMGSIRVLAEHAKCELSLNTAQYRLLIDLIRRYFNGRASIQDLAKRNSVSRNTAGIYNTRIGRELRLLENRSIQIIDDRLSSLGLLIRDK